MKLVEKEPVGRYVFVGDTHGDLDASEKVFDKYHKDGASLVFLGDYVDRGRYSGENADFLLGQRARNPESVYLLQGNHETFMDFPFSPADFWHFRLDHTERKLYSALFDELPMVFSVGDIIATHGALPDVKCLGDIEKIEKRDKNWMAMLWGDFYSEWAGWDRSEIRPKFNKEYFNRVMGQLDKNVLIRSHQPHISTSMFDKRLATIFTSNAYGGIRNVAIADFDKVDRVRDLDDLEFEIV